MRVLFILLFFSSYALAQQLTQDRVALVIGAQNYDSAPLSNTLNDARDMAVTLRAKGFEVIELYDPKSKNDLKDAVRQYFEKLNGKTNATGLFYYAGHGMQVDGTNYLIPIHADPKIKADLDDQCLKIDYVMQAMEQLGNGLNICILDACRNNPFRSFDRSTEKGLSTLNAPKGSYIIYSTKPGSVASDGTGRNGLFTSKLLKFINVDGLSIEQVFKRVAAEVITESGDKQRPWISADYVGEFYFTPGKEGTDPVGQGNPVVSQEAGTRSAPEGLDYGYGTKDAPLVVIGKQTWTKRNLNVDKFRNGDPIPYAHTAKEWETMGREKRPAWCYFDNNFDKQKLYGRLYNWYAVNDPRGLAPVGYHVASSDEWMMMIEYHGGMAVAKRPIEKSLLVQVENKNFYNFLGSYRNKSGQFSTSDVTVAIWTSTNTSKSDVDQNAEFFEINTDALLKKSSHRGLGMTVRCIKD